MSKQRIIELALADRWREDRIFNNSDPEVDAGVALSALEAAGYSVVRIEQSNVWEDEQGGVWMHPSFCPPLGWTRLYRVSELPAPEDT